MASGSIGSTFFKNPVSIGITLGSNTYPKGTFCLTDVRDHNNAFWRKDSVPNCYIDMYLCDSAGNNKCYLFRVEINGGQYTTTYTPYSATVDAIGLKGKALYMVGVGYAIPNTSVNSIDYIRLFGPSAISLDTAEDKYSITVSAGTGGSLSASATEASPGTTIALYPSANTGYSFSSYTTSPTVSIVNNQFTMPSSAISITANFTKNSYTLTTGVSPSGYGTVTSGGSIEYGGTKSLTASPSTGRYFSSWSNSGGSLSSTTSNPTTFTMGAGNATVTANFGTNSYTLTTTYSGSGSVTAGGALNYGATKSLTATPGTGYSFSYWTTTSGSLSSTTSNPTTFTMGAGNATVTAVFVINSYALTTAASPAAGGSVTAGATLNYGATKSLTATANTGYSFSSWSKTAGSLSSTTSNPTTFTMGTSAATVTANFTHIQYTLTTASSPAAGGTTAGGGKKYYNDSCAISATAATGYTFSKWTTTGGTLANANAASTTLTMPNGNATVTASFTHNQYTLTVSKTPSAGGTVSGGGTKYYNDSCSISATAATGYRFVKWTTSSGGSFANANSASTTYTMPNGNATVTANFEKITYSVTCSVNPSGAGTCSASPASATMGDTVTLSQAPAGGYVFGSWSSNPSVTISNNTFTMPASNVAITANYNNTPDTCTLNKSAYVGGETAVLTINMTLSSYSHRYKLSFGSGMETEWVDLGTNVSTSNIYIPIAWSINMGSGASSGILTLETYKGTTLVGNYQITGLSYSPLDGTVPSFSVWRCDEDGNAAVNGLYARYSFVKPSSITSCTITYGQRVISVTDTPGDIFPNDKWTFDLGSNHMIHFGLTYGAETFSLSRDLPKVVVKEKHVI